MASAEALSDTFFHGNLFQGPPSIVKFIKTIDLKKNTVQEINR